jgi:hypothetical protein
MGDGRPSLWRVVLDAFRRRPDGAADARHEAHQDYARFQAEMRAGGYVEWASTSPTGRDVVQCRRFEWPRMEIMRPADVHPEMNVAGLYWRDAGSVVDVEGSANPVIENIRSIKIPDFLRRQTNGAAEPPAAEGDAP